MNIKTLLPKKHITLLFVWTFSHHHQHHHQWILLHHNINTSYEYGFQLGMVGFLATSWVLVPDKKNGAVSLFHWGHFAVDSSKGSGGFIPQVTASAVVRTVVWKLISNINKKRKTFLAIPSIIVEFWRESKWNGSNKCNSSVFVD